MQLQAPLPRGPGTRVWSRLCRLKLGDHVDFDASAKWQLCHTDGAARMDAPLAEHLNKEFRRPIRNSVRFREVRCAVDHDKELYDSSNAAKIADGGFKHGQEFNCHVARGELTLIQANLLRPLSRRGAYRPPCQGGQRDEFGRRNE